MKTPIYIIIVLFLFSACSGGKADYGKTISAHLMAKAPAGKGYKVEIVNLEDLTPVTVADSIEILANEFEKDRKAKIEHIRGLMGLTDLLPEGSAEKQKLSDNHRHSIDSLENLAVPLFYENSSPDKILARPVRCEYTVTAENASSPITETFDFWLSPDCSTVLYQKRAR